MKKIAFITIIGTLFLSTISCSKDKNCSFSKTTFENKTYGESIIKIDSSGVDITASFAALVETTNPCFNNTITLNTNGTYTVNKVSNCTYPVANGIWSISTKNGKNYIEFDGKSMEVASFDCNSLTTIDINGNMTNTFKMSKI